LGLPLLLLLLVVVVVVVVVVAVVAVVAVLLLLDAPSGALEEASIIWRTLQLGVMCSVAKATPHS
jgi:hypothetical protein